MSRLKVFVASGNELAEERQETIMVLTRLGKAHPHLNIEPVEWEIDLPSGSVTESTIQQAINQKLAPCTVVLVIVYSRIGKHTLAEYRLAMKLKKKVFFYFKTKFKPKNQQEIDDYAQVEKFIKKKKDRVLIQKYRTLKDFHACFYGDLNLYLAQEYTGGDGGDGSKRAGKDLTPLPPRLGAFIGREDELKSLEAQLQKQAPVLLVQGLGGIGKTELCKHYLWKHDDDYQQVGWLDYSGSLKATFVSQIEVPDLDIPVSGTLDERFAPIRRYLAGLDKDTLLVIDNIDWPEDPDLPLLAAWRCRVLANSRCRLEGFSLFALEFLSKEACRELFIRHCPAQAGERDTEAIDRLVERAGRHTLTVELLARTAHAAGLTAPALDKKLAETGFNLNEVIQENIATLWGNDKSKHTFFEHLGRVFDLSGLSGEEKTVLANISLLPALAVELAELKEWLGLESADSLNRLVDKGWLKRAGNGLEMHAVIGEVVRYKEKPTAKTCKQLIKALAGKLYKAPGDNPLDKKGYVVFGAAVVERLADADEDLATLANNLSLRFQDLGQLDRALPFQLKTTEIFEKVLGADHPSLATSYNNLSGIYQDLGQLDKALEFQLKDVAISEKVLGKDHPDLATSYNNLSMIYKALGQLDRALAFQLKTTEIFEKVLGPDHPDLATSYNNLSMIYKNLGQLDKALEFQLKTLEIEEKVLGPDHPSLATSYSNLSTIYEALGQLDKALEFQLKDVAISEKVLGKDHPELATSYNNLSLIYQALGQLDRAMAFQQKALEIKEKVLGADHPDLATSYNNLSLIYRALGELDKALDYGRRAVAILARLFPNGHPNLDLYRKNLAIIEAEAGKKKK